MQKFNIRVYGLLVNDRSEVLVSDEERFGRQFTKFPGGGLEWGEGILDALKREFLEELNISIHVLDLFYFTDYFQVSAFDRKDQLLSIYYLISSDNWKSIVCNESTCKVFSKTKENHRWISLKTIMQEDMTFPTDKIVVEKIKKTF